MSSLLPEKINQLLAQRGLLKRDLARALGISPQTATDICKGRSAVTLQHLRRLVTFFGLRADFWLDESRSAPTEADELIPNLDEKIRALAQTGILHADDPAGLFDRMRAVVIEHRVEYLQRFGEPTREERRILHLPETSLGSVGRIMGGAEA